MKTRSYQISRLTYAVESLQSQIKQIDQRRRSGNKTSSMRKTRSITKIKRNKAIPKKPKERGVIRKVKKSRPGSIDQIAEFEFQSLLFWIQYNYQYTCWFWVCKHFNQRTMEKISTISIVYFSRNFFCSSTISSSLEHLNYSLPTIVDELLPILVKTFFISIPPAVVAFISKKLERK